MPATSLSPFPEPDGDADERAQRQAKLRQLTVDAQQVISESKLVVAAHVAARERMAQAIEEARARLARVRALRRPSPADRTKPR